MPTKFAKDPNAPKRPQTAYFRFVAECRPAVIAQNPHMKSDIAAFGKHVGALWKNCTAEDKATYVEAANADMVAWKQRMEVYKQTDVYKRYQEEKKKFNGTNHTKSGMKKLQKLLVNHPKRPSTSFMLFSNDVRGRVKDSNPNWGIAQVAKEVGKQWAVLDEERKKGYQEAATSQRTNYNLAMDTYKQTDEWKNYQTELKKLKESHPDAKKKALEKARAAKAKQTLAKAKEAEKAKKKKEAAKKARERQRAYDQKQKEKAKKKKASDRVKALRAKAREADKKQREKMKAKKKKAAEKKKAMVAKKRAEVAKKKVQAAKKKAKIAAKK